jgi:hypothetical protein
MLNLKVQPEVEAKQSQNISCISLGLCLRQEDTNSYLHIASNLYISENKITWHQHQSIQFLTFTKIIVL